MSESINQQHLIHVQLGQPVARVIIDHPVRRNAFTRSMWRELPSLVEKALADPVTRAICIQSSTPGMFAAGADISEFAQTYTSADEAQRAAAEIQDAIEAIDSCHLPTVALIDGACVGGGVALAVACDLRVSSSRSRFAVTPARLGLSYHPDDVQRLVKACGYSGACELLLTAHQWDAQRALACGLVQQLWPSESFTSDAEKLLENLAANSLDALVAIKETLRAVASSRSDLIDKSAKTFLDLFSGPDFVEGRDSFLAKRAAAFPSHSRKTKP